MRSQHRVSPAVKKILDNFGSCIDFCNVYPLLASRHYTYPKAPSWYQESETDVDLLHEVVKSRSAQLQKLKLTIKKNQGVATYAKYLLCTEIAIMLSRYPLFIILALFQLLQAVPTNTFYDDAVLDFMQMLMRRNDPNSIWHSKDELFFYFKVVATCFQIVLILIYLVVETLKYGKRKSRNSLILTITSYLFINYFLPTVIMLCVVFVLYLFVEAALIYKISVKNHFKKFFIGEHKGKKFS